MIAMDVSGQMDSLAVRVRSLVGKSEFLTCYRRAVQANAFFTKRELPPDILVWYLSEKKLSQMAVAKGLVLPGKDPLHYFTVGKRPPFRYHFRRFSFNGKNETDPFKGEFLSEAVRFVPVFAHTGRELDQEISYYALADGKFSRERRRVGDRVENGVFHVFGNDEKVRYRRGYRTFKSAPEGCLFIPVVRLPVNQK